MSYIVRKDCKEHKPFPIAMCAKCLPPNISIKRQPYRHIDFVSMHNSQEIGAFSAAWAKKDYAE